MFDGATAVVPPDQKLSASTGEGSAAPCQPLQNNRSVVMQSVGFNSLFQSVDEIFLKLKISKNISE